MFTTYTKNSFQFQLEIFSQFSIVSRNYALNP